MAKRCPGCGSFIRADAELCSVCGANQGGDSASYGKRADAERSAVEKKARPAKRKQEREAAQGEETGNGGWGWDEW